MNNLPPPPTSVVRTMQIIWFALLMGVTVFAGVAFFLRLNKPPAEAPFLSYIALAFAAGAIVMSILVPLVIGKQAVAQATANLGANASSETVGTALANVYQALLIISLAILEGGAFFALVAYQTEGVWLAMAAAGVLWLLLAIRFPTATRIEDWCRSQYETAMLDRPQ